MKELKLQGALDKANVARTHWAFGRITKCKIRIVDQVLTWQGLFVRVIGLR